MKKRKKQKLNNNILRTNVITKRILRLIDQFTLLYCDIFYNLHTLLKQFEATRFLFRKCVYRNPKLTYKDLRNSLNN